MRDATEDGFGGLAGDLGGLGGVAALAAEGYQAARIVEPPQGRQRAARVAESGTLGGPRPSSRVTVWPFEDLRRKHDAGEPGPDPGAAFREVASAIRAEHSRGDGDDHLEDPSGALLSQGGFIWLAAQGFERKPVGCVAMRRRRPEAEGEGEGVPTTWEVIELGVAKANRRQGVGRLLVEALLRQYEEAAGEGEALTVEVPATFDGARAFLLKMGFQEEDNAAQSLVYKGRHVPRGDIRTTRPSDA